MRKEKQGISRFYSAFLTRVGENSFFIGVISLFLGGCGNGESMQQSQTIVGYGWASPPDPYEPGPLYCYRTLGSVDCYKNPQAHTGPLEGFYADPAMGNNRVANEDSHIFQLPLGNELAKQEGLKNTPWETERESHVLENKPDLSTLSEPIRLLK